MKATEQSAAHPTAAGAAPPAGVVLRQATSADLARVEQFLSASALPTAGVRESLHRFIVAELDGGLVGVAGLEVHGEDGVLRSVAVAPSLQGAGLGGRLTGRVIEQARSCGLRRLYLLTTTAAAYFPRLGFHPIERDTASPAVRASVEFAEACPASAVAMVLDLG